MIGFDTNLLIRFITRDDSPRAALVEHKLEALSKQGIPCYVSVITLCEMLWVLSRSYGYRKKQLIGIARMMAESDDFVIEAQEAVGAALDAYRTAKASLADILIGLCNRRAGCDTTFTFDASAAQLKTFTLLT